MGASDQKTLDKQRILSFKLEDLDLNVPIYCVFGY